MSELQVKQSRDGSKTILKAKQSIAKSELSQAYRVFTKEPSQAHQIAVEQKLNNFAEIFGKVSA
jgi:hypothetical protein